VSSITDESRAKVKKRSNQHAVLAQAIATLAYGTRCILRVEKIVDPGNLYTAPHL
jgi:hypothetical protein